MTQQRKLLFSLLLSSGKHLTANDLLSAARASMPNIALGTVYRNLSLMVRDGAVIETHIPNAPAVYEAAKGKHDHMVCNTCGAIRDVFIPGLSDAIDYQTGEKTLSYHLTVSYTCEGCRKKRQS